MILHDVSDLPIVDGVKLVDLCLQRGIRTRILLRFEEPAVLVLLLFDAVS